MNYSGKEKQAAKQHIITETERIVKELNALLHPDKYNKVHNPQIISGFEKVLQMLTEAPADNVYEIRLII